RRLRCRTCQCRNREDCSCGRSRCGRHCRIRSMMDILVRAGFSTWVRVNKVALNTYGYLMLRYIPWYFTGPFEFETCELGERTISRAGPVPQAGPWDCGRWMPSPLAIKHLHSIRSIIELAIEHVVQLAGRPKNKTAKIRKLNADNATRVLDDGGDSVNGAGVRSLALEVSTLEMSLKPQQKETANLSEQTECDGAELTSNSVWRNHLAQPDVKISSLKGGGHASTALTSRHRNIAFEKRRTCSRDAPRSRCTKLARWRNIELRMRQGSPATKRRHQSSVEMRRVHSRVTSIPGFEGRCMDWEHGTSALRKVESAAVPHQMQLQIYLTFEDCRAPGWTTPMPQLGGCRKIEFSNARDLWY
ncbi:hypothetical protein BKA93DRAFT_839167, partial [Sparassis latifolia]